MAKILCSRHQSIIDFAQEITRLCQQGVLSTNPEELKRTLINIKELSSSIHLETKEAMTSGQRMEKRLRAYKDAIENLGFLRKKV